MNFDIRRTIDDLVTKDAIAIPSDKQITLLRNNSTYDKFLDIRAAHSKAINHGVVKTVAPVVIGLALSGVNYFVTRRISSNMHDQAQLLINEAIADNN